MPDGQPAPLPDDTNPYASPKAPTDPNWKVPQQIEGAWRRGDEMLLAGRKSKTPRACWVSDRTTWVHAGSLASMPKKARSALLLLLALPVLGYALVAVYVIVNALFGRFPRVSCWLRTRAIALHGTVETVSNVLMGIGCVGTNVVCIKQLETPIGPAQAFATYAGFFLVLGAGIALDAVKDRAILGLTVERQEDGLVHVRGVHPDYLARLPEYPGQEMSGSQARMSTFGSR